jgi:hypothetical protein
MYTHTWPRPAAARSVSLLSVCQPMAAALWRSMRGPLARRRHTRTRACLLPPHPRPLRRMRTSSAASPMQPHQSHTAPLSTAITVMAPEDVEHAVGRRREAHAEAPGGAGAGGEGVEPLEVAQKQEDAYQPAKIHS